MDQITPLNCHEHDVLFVSPEQAAAGQPTVAMSFPVDVALTTVGQQKIHYTPGIHEVPEILADHWYLKSNGVTRCVPLPVVDDSVEMLFPGPVKLQECTEPFPKGINRVPAHLADHWYLKANGVTRVEPKQHERTAE